jgi:uncharacterized protein YndB with AHSA1/START domain
MPDILQDFPIRTSPDRVYEAFAEPALLDQWWTVRSAGQPHVGATYELDFGPAFEWRAVVTRAAPGQAFEWRVTEADADWTGTLVGVELTPSQSGTHVQFHHRGWPAENAHFRTSTHCWALYLRLLRRLLVHGEFVPYERRLDA